jgi:glyoxylase-like metal-dependent hydrolase (beta-lactamase superfamily II)
MKLAHIFSTAWLMLLALAPAIGAQPGTLKPIVPGVWFREGETEFSHANNVIIEMADYLIVVDANYPSGAKAVINDAKKVSSKPIKYVIDTHADPDHAYGNAVFTAIGAITIGYEGMLGDIRRVEPRTWKQTAGWNKSVAELNQPGPEPPQKTYSESPYVISDGTRRVELHHFTFGHTRGDTFIYLPKEKVLCTGDAVVNGPFSDPKHSYMDNWANEVRAAQQLDVRYVLPGHGKDGARSCWTARFDSSMSSTRSCRPPSKRARRWIRL